MSEAVDIGRRGLLGLRLAAALGPLVAGVGACGGGALNV